MAIRSFLSVARSADVLKLAGEGPVPIHRMRIEPDDNGGGSVTFCDSCSFDSFFILRRSKSQFLLKIIPFPFNTIKG